MTRRRSSNFRKLLAASDAAQSRSDVESEGTKDFFDLSLTCRAWDRHFARSLAICCPRPSK